MADEKTFTQDELDAAIEKAVGPLKTKIEEVMDEAKEAKRKLRAASEIKPEDLTAAEDRADKAEAKVKELDKAAKDAIKAKETAEKALETESGFTHKLLVENGLREQLVSAGVTHPAHQKGAIAMLSGQVQVAVDGETRTAKVGDKALADFIKEWAGGDEGKAFITAPNNSGSGAPGSKDKPAAGKTVTRDAFDAMPAADRMAFSKDGGKVVDAVA